MNTEFARKIAFRCSYRQDSNATIAENLSIHKNTVARIRKIYNCVKWESNLNMKEAAKIAKKHNVSRNVVFAIYKVARQWQ